MSWKTLLLSLVIISVVCGVSQAASWVVYELQEWDVPGSEYSKIEYSFDGRNLSLNTPSVNTAGGSSTQTWELLTTGKWAVTGSVDAGGILTSDPYAKFVYDGYGGYIDWASNTPIGYSTNLLLGYSFAGDGAGTYYNTVGGETYSSTTGTVVVWSHLPMRPGEYSSYESYSHSFDVSYGGATQAVVTPEPSSLLALLSGVTALGGVIMRNRNRNSRLQV